jgi:hypothetical protein
MACSCQKPKSGTAKYVVTAANGAKKTYATETEATAAAKRTGGTWKKQQ